MATYYWVGGAGTWSGTGNTQFALTSGGAATLLNPTSADVVNFDANSGTGTCTIASGATCDTLVAGGANITIQLNVNFTATSLLRVNAGTFNLNNNTATSGVITSNVNAVRTIAFGSSGKFVCTRTATSLTAVDFYNATTAATLTGTPLVEFTGATIAGASIGVQSDSATPSNPLSVKVSNGAGTFTFGSNFGFGSVDLTGFNGTLANTAFKVYGNLTIPSTTTLTAGTGTLTFSATSGTQQITTNGKTLDFPITQNGVGGTVQLQDNLTMGSTRTYTLTNGALDLNNLTLSAGLFSSSNSNTRVIAFGTGNITTTGVGTVWNTASTTGFSYTGTPTVNISNNSATATTVSTGAMIETRALNFSYTTGTYTLTDTSAVYKSVNFTGFSGTIPNSTRIIYGGATFSAGMTLTAGANITTFAATSGTNNITTAAKTLDFPITFFGLGGTFAFQDALTQGATRAFTFTAGTVQFKASATSTTGVFATSGASQKFLQSTTPGTQATLSQASGTVDVSHLTIQDNAAVGGATFNAYVDQGNVDAGNVEGWDFGISPIVGGAEYTYSMRSFTQSRRF
jgi:hypothetical protein